MPEWQLWEGAKNAFHLVTAYTADADRYTNMAAAAREKYEKYNAALVKLGAKLI